MCEDGDTVLVAGGREKRVARVTELLARTLSVRTFDATDGESRLPSGVAVAVFADGIATEHAALERLPDDCARIAVVRDADALDGDRAASFERVLFEPVVADDLRSTVITLARRVRYDRRLRECAELATSCDRASSNDDANSESESRMVCEEIADAKAEIDGLVAEFSGDDFREAFQALAAD